ncbi:MAG: hypothetical protein WCI75_18295, partial [candidate division NC10 bacterium]
MKIQFWKVSGGGNDFVLVDSSSIRSIPGPVLARRLCPRRDSVGADGLLLIRSGRADKEHGSTARSLASSSARGKAPAILNYFNSDGSRAFCGNGALRTGSPVNPKT